MLAGASTPVYAQDYVPSWIEKIISALGLSDNDGDGPVGWAKDRVKWALTILFVVVFIIAIVYSALAAIKFISSQGDASKLEESKGAVKAILMGFAAMIIAIVGIFIILWIFEAGTEFSNAINNVENTPGG
jgi:ABC-type Fe3+ transport system permease subunit